jgi:hypothetical protein
MMRPVHGIVVLAFVACLAPARGGAQAKPATSPPAGKAKPTQTAAKKPAASSACRVEGVWDLVSVTDSGKARDLAGYRQRKIVGMGHFMWIGADPKRDTIGLHTLTDSLRYSRVQGGYGTYALNGNKYTEHLDIFMIPTMEGQAFPATCRTEGDRWYHSYPPDSAKQTVELWKRVP